MDIKVFEFLGKEAPVALENIKEGIDLLVTSVDDGTDELGKLINKAVEEKEFLKINELSENSNKLNLISEKLQEFILELDNILNTRYVEEDLEGKGAPNYEDYLVDSEVEHGLYESFTHKRPIAFKIEETEIHTKDWKSMLVETLNYLSEKDTEVVRSFVNDNKMNGKKVRYFSDTESEIARGPRRIELANIYVETNLSANSIRNLLIKILKKCDIKVNDYKIYLRADYSELH